MGIYTRYKKSPSGFRQLVELLETTPKERQQKMIEAGILEDPEYTDFALKYVLSFQDVLGLPEPELAAVLSKANVRMIGLAFSSASETVKEKVLRNVPPRSRADVSDLFTHPVAAREIGAAQFKIIESARQCEKLGLIATKRLPESVSIP